MYSSFTFIVYFGVAVIWKQSMFINAYDSVLDMLVILDDRYFSTPISYTTIIEENVEYNYLNLAREGKV